jgi:hypothetical protein
VKNPMEKNRNDADGSSPIRGGHCVPLGSFRKNVGQNDLKNIYRAKHALSRVEGTPRRKVKNIH